MANKHIPDSIAGVELHPLTRSPAGRTRKLLKTLAARGVKSVDDDRLSMIDRFRLLASAYLTLTDPIDPDPRTLLSVRLPLPGSM